MGLPLFAHADDEKPLRLFVDDPTLGRRVPIELRLERGRSVVAFIVDEPEFDEPPLAETPRTSPLDPRQVPIDADDFRQREPVG
jgi:hypothetical protein